MSLSSEKPLVIPIFIPHCGCPHHCAFCNQSIITNTDHPLPGKQEIQETVNRFLGFRGTRQKVQLAFFGGNFLGLETDTITRFLDIARELVKAGKIHSVRCSTRPDTINRATMAHIRHSALTTVELGVQSMDDSVLIKSRRGHTAAQTLEAARLLREYHVETGMQMMVGLPGDTPETTHETAAQICRMAPDFVRIYPLIVLRGSPLARWFDQGRYHPLSLDAAVTRTKALYRIFQRHHIPVIRMGLQASDLLQEAGSMVAGPWHPAFGHLVFSELFLDKARDRITAAFSDEPPKSICLTVHPASQSRLRGDRNQNMARLQATFPRTAFTVATDLSLGRDDVVLR